MGADSIPVFPLATVLLPGAPQPMHVFEPRYRRLLADVTGGPRARHGFGIVALQRGLEAGTNENTVLSDVGTMGEIIELRRYDDGTADLLLVGSRRFRVLAVAETAAGYLQADIDWLPELDGEIRPGAVAAAGNQVRYYRALLARLVGQDDEREPLPTDPVRLSYALTQRLFLPIADRQRLLAADTAADRIRTAMALLRRETVLLQRTRSVPVPFASIRRVPAPN